MTFETDDNVDTGATENTAAEVETEQTQETEQVETETGTQEVKEEPVKKEKPRSQIRIEELARENAELRKYKQDQESQKNAPKPPEKPKVEDFETWSEYEDAQEEWRVNEAMRRLEEKQGKTTQDKAQLDQQIAFQSAVVELETEGVDVNKYIERASELPQLPIQLDQFGLSAKDTLKLATELLDDEETYISLSQMNPVQAAAKIGAMIESKKTKAPVPVSKAPPPIKPVQANASIQRSAESMSDNEFLKSRGL